MGSIRSTFYLIRVTKRQHRKLCSLLSSMFCSLFFLVVCKYHACSQRSALFCHFCCLFYFRTFRNDNGEEEEAADEKEKWKKERIVLLKRHLMMRSCVRTMRWLSPQCSIHQSQKLFSLSLCVCVSVQNSSLSMRFILCCFQMNWLTVASGRCEWDVHDFQMGRIYIIPRSWLLFFRFPFCSVLFSSSLFHSAKWNMQKCIYFSQYNSFDFNQFRWNTQRCPATTSTKTPFKWNALISRYETQFYLPMLCAVPSTRFTCFNKKFIQFIH